MITEFVSRMFALRDASHLAHWSTKSFAEHMALGSFYEDLIEKVDAIIESYQGCFGLIGEVETRRPSKADIRKQIADTANWLASNKEKICEDNDVLSNLIDDLGQLFATTHYKLRFLK